MEAAIDLTDENEESLSGRKLIVKPIPFFSSEEISETSEDDEPPPQSGIDRPNPAWRMKV